MRAREGAGAAERKATILLQTSNYLGATCDKSGVARVILVFFSSKQLLLDIGLEWLSAPPSHAVEHCPLSNQLRYSTVFLPAAPAHWPAYKYKFLLL